MRMKLFIPAAVLFLFLTILTVNQKPMPRSEDSFTTAVPSPSITSLSSARSDIPRNVRSVNFLFNNRNLTVYYARIPGEATVGLIGNFNNPVSGEEITRKNNCTMAINGGFYTPQNLPLGLFYTEGKTYAKNISSNLVNGYFYQDKNNRRSLSFSPPENLANYSFALQTGPFLIVSEKSLRLVSDDQSRRSLLGTDENNSLYLITVMESGNTLTGPLLADIPRIFNSDRMKEKIRFTYLLNLDGGSSAFYFVKDADSKLLLEEIMPIGSLLCIK